MPIRMPTTGHEIIGPHFEEETHRRNGLCPARSGTRLCWLRPGHDGEHDFDFARPRRSAATSTSSKEG